MRRGFRVIDSDGHLSDAVDPAIYPEGLWRAYVDPEFRERAPRVIVTIAHLGSYYAPCEFFPEGSELYPFPQAFDNMPKKYGQSYDEWWSPKRRLIDMDTDGVDKAVLFTTTDFPVNTPMALDLKAALIRAFNDWAIDEVSQCEGRVRFIGLMTLDDIDEGLREIKRMSSHPEVTGFFMPDLPGETPWCDPALDPVYDLLAQEDLACCFHGFPKPEHSAFRKWWNQGFAVIPHALDFPFALFSAMSTIIFGGTLERHPKLRVGFYEGNVGWVPWFLSRLDDHAVGRQKDFYAGRSLSLKPSEYFLRQCWVAADPDEAELKHAAEWTGGGNILFNTDYPHIDAPFPGSVDAFLDKQHLPEDTFRKILWDNPVEIYGPRLDAKA